MLKEGDVVRFHATTPEWGIGDWDEDANLVMTLDGSLAVVTGIMVDHNGDPIYADLHFEGDHKLYAISLVHVEPMPGVLLFTRKAS